MAALTVTDVVNKWASRGAAATGDYEKGVRAVQESPTARAAQQLELAKSNYVKAIDDGRTAAALNRVTRDDWINITATKGKARFADGINSAKPKFTNFMTRFLPVTQQAKSEVRNMPKGTRQAALDRVGAVIDKFKQFAGKSY